MAALEFDHVTKRYPVGAAPYRSLRGELSALAMPRRGRSDGRSRAERPAALHDISFAVETGEALGIIGPNGAGKSTALRIAARITAPTTGTVTVRGRVGALIEVGAGIHPELTGRENIWLYGAILGLRRPEIARRFDDIVDFAEVGTSLDLPIKRWSSGMQLRLGFAIASAGAPDVFVVDEALAVGDARFQIRCLDRMADLVRAGTTLVYVSHDLAGVQAICDRVVLLVGGEIRHLGSAAETISAYLQWVDSGQRADLDSVVGVFDIAGDRLGETTTGASIEIRVRIPRGAVAPVTIAIGVRDGHPWNVLGAVHTFTGISGFGISGSGISGVGSVDAGAIASCRIDDLPLDGGVYDVWATVDGDDDGRWHEVGRFRVVGGETAGPRPLWLPSIRVNQAWHLIP